MKTIYPIICIAAIALIAGCSSTSSRISKDEGLFNTYAPSEKKLIRTSQVAVGFDQDQVRMSLGDPSRETTVGTTSDKQIAWEYREIKPTIGLSLAASTGSSGVDVGVRPKQTKLLKRIVFNRQTGNVESIHSFD